MKETGKQYMLELKEMLDTLDLGQVEQLVNLIKDAYKNDKQIFIIGNGGSASAASHMACDIGKNTGIIGKQRMRVVSLTDNMATFSAVANDCGYDAVFKEQLAMFLNPGDLVIGISGSGNSPNVINALKYANETGAITAAIVAFTGGEMKKEADYHVMIKTGDYGVAEDAHLILNHMIVRHLQKDMAFEHKLEQQSKGLSGDVQRIAVGPQSTEKLDEAKK
ncbi:SIS domain-containing protein [Candidatus Woesearchaeota archaeon]|nr:SIS domain-containing protein [Candidatus Woesearchaeota archaeon]